MDLSGRWSGGGWVCANLVVFWVVGRVVMGWVLLICWCFLGFVEK